MASDVVKREVGCYSLLETWSIFQGFHQKKFHKDAQSFSEFLEDWSARLKSAERVGLVYPDNILALNLLNQSSLQAEEARCIIITLEAQLKSSVLRAAENTGLLTRTAEMLKLYFEEKLDFRDVDDKICDILDKLEEDTHNQDQQSNDDGTIEDQQPDDDHFEDQPELVNDIEKAKLEIKWENEDEFEAPDDFVSSLDCDVDICEEEEDSGEEGEEHGLEEGEEHGRGEGEEHGRWGEHSGGEGEEFKDKVKPKRKYKKRLSVKAIFLRCDGTCPDCGKIFTEPRPLRMHMRICKASLRCYICKQQFASTDELDHHKKSHDVHCEICFKQISSLLELNRHYTRVHAEKKFKCDQCDKAFPTQKLLDYHMKCHEARKVRQDVDQAIIFKCHKCGLDFSGKINLRQHLRQHLEFKCESCYRFYPTQEQLDKHVLNHKIYRCDECDVSFTVKHKYNKHMKAFKHGGMKNFQCDKCDKSYSTMQHLGVHYTASHTLERNFHCSVCGKKFCSKDRLDRHMRIHTGERPYGCDICHKRFTQSGDKSRHMRTHLKAAS